MSSIKDIKEFEDYTNTVDLSGYSEGTRIEIEAQYVINDSIHNFYTNFLFNKDSICKDDDNNIMLEYSSKSIKAIPLKDTVTECIISWCTII